MNASLRNKPSSTKGPAAFRDTVARLKRTHRTFRLVEKHRSPLMKTIYWGLLMFWWCPRFMESYTTTLISWVYMPADLFDTWEGYKILRHEQVHIRDCLHTGIIPFVLSYLFFLPTVFTLRAWWEFRAYRETMKVEKELTGTIAESTVTWITARFTSSEYLWMCPFPAFVRARLHRCRRNLLDAP
jgi:hypothetical protein